MKSVYFFYFFFSQNALKMKEIIFGRCVCANTILQTWLEDQV